MESEKINQQGAQRGDVLRYNGKEFVAFPHSELIRSLNEEIDLLKKEIEKMKREQKQQISDILMIVKELSK